MSSSAVQATTSNGTIPRGSVQPEERSLPLLPIVAFVALWLGIPWLAVGFWLHPLVPGGWTTLTAAFTLVAAPVGRLVQGVRGASYPSGLTRLLLFRPFWYAMLFLPLLAAAALLGGLAGFPFGTVGPTGRWGLGLAASILAIGSVAGYLGSRRLTVRYLDVQLPRLPKAFDGLRVVQLSDLHVGPHTSQSFLARIAETTRRENPDLIVYTGDQVDDFARDVEIFNATFAGLQAPFGQFVVAGNHDVYAGWSAVRQGLAAAGFSVLQNEAIALERTGARLWIAGTGDPAAGPTGRSPIAPDIPRTLASIPDGEPVLALAHNPALWPALAQRRVDLTLSGHTHYGQLAIPSRNWSMASPFLDLAMGSHRLGDSLLYINPGTNYWGIPFRIGTPPEVTVLTLRSGEQAVVATPS